MNPYIENYYTFKAWATLFFTALLLLFFLYRWLEEVVLRWMRKRRKDDEK